MIWRITKELLESMHLCKATGKGEWREWMAGIIFDTAGNVFATQGHIMLTGRNDLGKPGQGFILDIPKTPADAKKYSVAEIDIDALEIRYLGPDELENPIMGKSAIRVLQWVIPEKVSAMMEKPPAEPVTGITFNAGYLAMMEKVCALWEKKLTGQVYIELRGDDRLAVMNYVGGKSIPVKLLVCPIKV